MPASRWSTRAEWFDWLVVAVVVVLSVVTVWIASELVRGPWDAMFASVGWAVAGAAWSFTVAVRSTNRAAWIVAVGLLFGSLATLLVFGPITALVFFDVLDLGVALVALAVGVAIVLFVLFRQRPSRLIWLAAPVLTLATVGLYLSDIPTGLRFAAAEPALVAFVGDVRAGTTGFALPEEYDDPVTIGGVPIFEVMIEDGQVRLVTGYVGILGDDAAGIVYVDEGAPVKVGRSEHVTGHWYRWYPY